MKTIYSKGKIVATIFDNEHSEFLLKSIQANAIAKGIELEVLETKDILTYEEISQIIRENYEETFKAMMYLEVGDDFESKEIMEKYLTKAYYMYTESDLNFTPSQFGYAFILARENKENFNIEEVEENLYYGLNFIQEFGA
jgi:hypothetical protein